MKYFFAIFFIILTITAITPFSVYAQEVGQLQKQVQELLKQIELLKTQITTLQTQVQTTRKEVAEVKVEIKELQYTKPLGLGDTGEKVREYQEALKQAGYFPPDFKPTLFFGPLTLAATNKFQKEVLNINPINTAGPQTFGRLNELISKQTLPPVAPVTPVTPVTPTTPITPTTLTIPTTPVSSSGGGSGGSSLTSVAPVASVNLTSSSSGELPATQSNSASATTLVGSSYPAYNWGAPPIQDTTFPVISNVQVSNITATSATFTWTTDEYSNSQIYYSLNPGVSIASNYPITGDSGTSHSVNAFIFDSEKTYYYVVVSKDNAGNQSISSEKVFTTLAVATDSPPVITAFVKSANELHPNDIYAGLRAYISVSITDDLGLINGGFNAPGMRYSSADVSLYQCNNGVKSCSEPVYIIIPNNPGDYNIIVKATDTTGHTKTKTVSFVALGCSADSECGGTYFPSGGATFCGSSEESVMTKRMKYQVVSLCQAGSCNEKTEPGILEDCSASGKICGFAKTYGGQFQCVISSGVDCAANASITSSCLCGSQSYEQYGNCCLDANGKRYHSTGACQLSLSVSTNNLATVFASLTEILKSIQQLMR